MKRSVSNRLSYFLWVHPVRYRKNYGLNDPISIAVDNSCAPIALLALVVVMAGIGIVIAAIMGKL